jgi:hypothetical protein
MSAAPQALPVATFLKANLSFFPTPARLLKASPGRHGSKAAAFGARSQSEPIDHNPSKEKSHV